MPELTSKIDKTAEKEIYLETNEFFRPDLKQIGSSISEIRNHFCNADEGHICVVPEIAEKYFKDIHNDLLILMEKSPFFHEPHDSSTLKGGLIFISASLAPIVNICSETIPDNLQCDLFVLVPHQPVTLISVVGVDCKSLDAIKYNVSMARGVTARLAKFMDECVSPLFGVLDVTVLKKQKMFNTKIESLRKCSSLFVTPKSFSMTSAKFDKILTAFWAVAAETTSVKCDGVDDWCLRFLTKNQCIILLENMDRKEVVVECHPGCGGSTLMLEIAKRLSTVGETVMVCDSVAESEDFGIANLSVKTYADLSATEGKTPLHVVHGNGELPFVPNGRQWRFVKTQHCETAYKEEEIEKPYYKVMKAEPGYSMSSFSHEEIYTSFVKTNDPLTEKLLIATSPLELLKEYLETTGRERIHKLLLKKAEHEKEIFSGEKIPFDDIENELISMMLPALSFQFPMKDPDRQKTSTNADLDAFIAKMPKEGRDQIPEIKGPLSKITELKEACQKDPEIFHHIRQEVLADKQNISYLEAKVAYFSNMQRNGDRQQDKEESLQCQEPVRCFPSKQGHNTVIHQVHRLRQYEHGTLNQNDIYTCLQNVICEGKKVLSELYAESKSLDEDFGCPVYIVGEAGSRRSRPLSCPDLAFDKNRVNTDVAHISEDDELINMPNERSHQGSFRFKRYRGTCTSRSITIPSGDTEVPPSPQYWETRVRGLVKRDVPVWRILFETGVSERSQLDTKYMESAQLRSWCFVLADCGMHEGICTKIWGEGKLIKCIKNTMVNAPNSYNVHNYGVVLDVWQGRLAFIDLNSEIVLHKFDIDFKEDLYPMCGAWLYPDDYLVAMKLVSGSEIVMTPNKMSLIHSALYTHDEL